MIPQTTHAKNEPPVLFHVKWVARIALSVGVVAVVGAPLAIFLATNENGGGYARIVVSHSLTQQSLGPLMLIFGLLLVVVAAIATWSIALYSSFRIAGPLFRFSQNLRDVIENPFAVPMAIRQTDMLQREWTDFDASQARLREHYASLRQALDHCRRTAPGSADADTAGSAPALARLQDVERRVQL
ncbi:MAG: hypothetical protein Q7J42_04105 [Sulfuritalea sp.]|nr:hypothetical protein [Sulfuritalea sp.]